MLCEKENCTGCFACYNICPKNAICMKEDEYGYIYPEIDKEKCINCHLCEKSCPALNSVEKSNSQKCYAAFSRDSKIRNNSSSGGIATVFSKKVLKSGGVVYGASFGKSCEVEHIRVADIKDLYKLQGSKYVHSYINETFKNVRADLNNGKQVLFIGTPCQIAGLKGFLNKKYDNLLLVDIICHGVPSQKYLKDEISSICDDLNVESIRFRNNNSYQISVIKDGKVISNTPIEKSPYLDAFIRTINLRENCYSCKYANKNRISDITIGDFWGLNIDSKFYKEKEEGVSVVIVSTDKGKDFLEECRDDIELEERSYEEAIKGNSQLQAPARLTKKQLRFKKYYIKYGLKKAYKKTTKYIRAKQKIKNIVKRGLKRNGKI